MQGFSDRDFFCRETNIRVLVERSDRIELIAESHRNPTGKKASTRRAAIGPRNIAIGKTHSICRDPINVRRGDFRIPLTTEFPIAEIIGKEDDDVGLIGRGDELEGQPDSE